MQEIPKEFITKTNTEGQNQMCMLKWELYNLVVGSNNYDETLLNLSFDGFYLSDGTKICRNFSTLSNLFYKTKRDYEGK